MSNEAKPLNSKMSFDEFKLNSDGMLTVVVQDHKTNEFDGRIYDKRSI